MARDKRWDSVPMLHYDTKALAEAVGIAAAVETYTGEKIVKNRIHCPSPNHSDKNPSCEVNPAKHPTACHCYACNESFDVFELAKFAKGDMPFQQLCEAVCADFSLDPYQFSNKREVEEAKQRVFGNGDSAPVFIEHCPLTSKELDIIGLHNGTNHDEIMYSVLAKEYYEREWDCLEEDLPDHIRERCYDKDGKPLMMKCTYGEMVELGYLEEKDNNGHEYLPRMTFQDVWKQDHEGAEQMMFDKCEETAENITKCMEKLSTFKEKYEAKVDVEREQKLLRTYTDCQIEHKPVRWTDLQLKRVKAAVQYENIEYKMKALAERLDDVERVYEKLVEYQADKAQAIGQNAPQKESSDLDIAG